MIQPKRLSPRPTPSRYPILTPYSIIRSDRCINCGTCIETCIYECHYRSQEDPRIIADPKENCCRYGIFTQKISFMHTGGGLFAGIDRVLAALCHGA